MHSRCCGTRISPKLCWVSLLLSRVEPLLSDAVIGEVRDVVIWKYLSCKAFLETSELGHVCNSKKFR